MLWDFFRVFPRRKLDREDQAAKFRGWIGHDRFNRIERIIRSDIGIADEVAKRFEESAFHLLGFRSPVFESRVVCDRLVHVGWIDTDDLCAEV